MDLTSTVRSDSLSSVGSLLVPGALASAPWLALVWGPPHNVKAFVGINEGVSTAVAALIVVSVGLLIESLGTYVEYYVIDNRHADRAAMLKRWEEYLRIAWKEKEEPIGQHYLRKVLMVFKFELNLLVASLLTLPATIALGYADVLPQHGLFWAVAATLALIGFLSRAAIDSSKLLDSLRKQLIQQARQRGALAQSTSAAE